MGINKKVLFRVDASLEMGTGHVMRCLTLANALVPEGYDSHFLCRDHKGNMEVLIKEMGHDITMLSCNDKFKTENLYESWLGNTSVGDAYEVIDVMKSLSVAPDLIVVDHYGIGKVWEKKVNAKAVPLLVIDDLANREHSCSFILDQTLNRLKSDYFDLVPDMCKIITGSSFALLKSNFSDLHEKSILLRKERNKVVMVNMGGSDPKNITQIALKHLIGVPDLEGYTFRVIGSNKEKISSGTLDEIDRLGIKIIFLDYVEDMAEEILLADFAFGAPGATSWERCCLGLPSVTIQTADNQKKVAVELASAGATIFAGNWDSVDTKMLTRGVFRLLSDKDYYEKMVLSCHQVCDGKGVTKVVENIVKNTSVSRL